jgi:hypothetical protein
VVRDSADRDARQGYYVERSRSDSAKWERATDDELGFAWISGEVVHGDADRVARTASFGVRKGFVPRCR